MFGFATEIQCAGEEHPLMTDLGFIAAVEQVPIELKPRLNSGWRGCGKS